MRCLHFGSTKRSSDDKEVEMNIYDVVAMSLKCGIRIDDLKEMSFESLAYILESFIPKKEKEGVKEATQQEIDFYF